MDPSEYNPLDSAVMADPFPVYAQMRAQCPVAHFDGLAVPYYVLFRYDDVREASTDTSLYSAKLGASPTYRDTATLTDDGPSHLAFRNTFQTRLMPRSVKTYEPKAQAFAESLVQAMLARGRRGELYEDFASPLPVKVIGAVLGIEDAHYATLKAYAEHLLDSAWMAKDADKQQQYTDDAHAFLGGYLDAHLKLVEDLAEPGPELIGSLLPDDIISDLVCGRVMGRRLTRMEMLQILQVLLVGGNETTTFLITNCIWRLLQDRQLWEAVQADPDKLIPAAIEESLRFDPPGLGLWRTTACPVSKHGTVMPANAKVQMSYGSANRDETVFENASEFRLDRPPSEARRHLTFGAGPHMCVGQHLARMEMAVALRTLLRETPDLRMDGDTERVGNFGFWGRRRFPVAW